ncbi:MAG: DNA polymerase III subunit delta [Bacteroidales bacterium]|nr:DNA polymerase III subunit delta [Bacteroidales bacterium]
MIKYEELVAQLKSRQFKPVYLLMGEEPFYIDRICRFFENKVIEEADRDFNQVVLYGKDTSAAEIVANAKEFPFGSQYKLVIVKEAKDLKDIDLLKSYVENPAESSILVLCHKYGKLKATQYKAYEKKGVVFESVGIKDWNLPDWVQKTASAFKFKLDAQTANILTEHIGNDLSRIFNEFEKLKVILPPGSSITPDVVEQYIGISKEYNIFELQEALGSRNAQKTFKIIHNFTQHLKENPNIKTILMLYNFYHKMLMYHLSPDKSNEALRAIYGNLPPMILSKNVRYAQSHTIAQLTNIISVLREYDVKSKGVDSNSEEGELLKEMIYKILQ